MLKLIDLIAAGAVIIINRIFHIMPIEITLRLGRFLGGLTYYIIVGRRKIAYANIRAAFACSKSPEELKEMVKNIHRNMGELAFETLSLTKVNDKYIQKYITMEDNDNYYKAASENNGVILLTAHLDNWELSALLGSVRGYKLFILAREQKMKRLNELLNRLRESRGAVVVRKGITTRYILKALKEGKIIAMVADQSGGPNGVMTTFFGRKVPTVCGSQRLAVKTGAVILPSFIIREKGPYHRVIVKEPIHLRDESEIQGSVQLYNDMLESIIREHCDQWLWFHRRWKLCPEKKVVILSDGKAGHLNQSLALAEAFKKYRTDKGILPETIDIKVIDVRFKSSFWKNAINVCGKFSNNACQGCLKCLKKGLTDESYEELIRTYADVVISTGSSMAGVNAIFTRENSAKNIVSMKPGILSLNKFKMVVLPSHDAVKKKYGKHVILSDITPNNVNSSTLESAKNEMLKHVTLKGKRVLGVLLGGDNDNFEYSGTYAAGILREIVKASEIQDADILVTTSRRTSANLEKTVKDIIGDHPRCRSMIIANEKNSDHAVRGILAAADTMIVSPDSISMVSEAVSSGKRVIVFKGKETGTSKRNKHKIFLENLEHENYITIAEPGNIAEIISADRSFNDITKKPKEKDMIYMNMWRLGG